MGRVPKIVCLSALAALALAAGPATTTRSVAPEADAQLKRTSDVLAAAKAFSCDVHAIHEQVEESGQRIDYARNQKLLVRRPDRAAATIVGDRESFRFFYDGKRVTVLNTLANVYGSIDAPNTLDETMDVLALKYGLSIPLADLVFADPYKVLTENIDTAKYLGTGWVLDTKCHHIACEQDAVDWQIWIDAGEKPLPRKVVIEYKRLPGAPRYTAFLSNWNLSPDAPDSAFAFTAPAGSQSIPWSVPSTQSTTRPVAPPPAGK